MTVGEFLSAVRSRDGIVVSARGREPAAAREAGAADDVKPCVRPGGRGNGAK